MAECQSAYWSLTHCHREQAPSHIWISIGLMDITRLLISGAPSTTLAARRRGAEWWGKSGIYTQLTEKAP